MGMLDYNGLVRLIGKVKKELKSLNERDQELSNLIKELARVSIYSSDIDITDRKGIIDNGGTATFNAVAKPSIIGTPRFRLYNGNTLISENQAGKASYGGVTLDCATGLFTTTGQYPPPVRVSAYVDSVESDRVLISRSIPIVSFDVSGQDEIAANGTYLYGVSNLIPVNNNRGISLLQANVSTPKSGSVAVSVPSHQEGMCQLIVDRPLVGEDITLTLTANIEGGTTVVASKTILLKGKIGFVDLGLPSGLLWADRNLGANEPEDFGLYFQWGDTEGHAKDSGYGFGPSEYNAKGLNNITSDLNLSQDAASVASGGGARMPTRQEFQELIDNCTFNMATENDVNGYRFTSKTNGNSIFFPAAGSYYYGNYFINQHNCWSSSKYNNSYAYDFSISNAKTSYSSTSYGMPIRAVQ